MHDTLCMSMKKVGETLESSKNKQKCLWNEVGSFEGGGKML